MSTDRQRWDARYAKQDVQLTPATDRLVTEAIAALLPEPRSALDLAAGGGRHSLWLAARGIETEAWDVSPVGLSLIDERAKACGLTIATRETDLSTPLPEMKPRELVLVVDFLDRDLFAQLHSLVAPGGVAVVCTFTDDFPGEHPSSRFRLRRGELHSLPGMDTEVARESDGRVLLVARKG